MHKTLEGIEVQVHKTLEGIEVQVHKTLEGIEVQVHKDLGARVLVHKTLEAKKGSSLAPLGMERHNAKGFTKGLQRG